MAALILIPAAVVAAYVLSRDAWHMLDEEKLSYEKLSVQVFDGDDRLYSALSGGEERLLVRIGELPEHVKNAFIAAEDARFYDHPGWTRCASWGPPGAISRPGPSWRGPAPSPSSSSSSPT